jgi:5-oxoprolinase (ATP-hydrolysing)
VVRWRQCQTPVYDRYALEVGDVIPGPAIIEEREATTVIAPATASPSMRG